MAKSPRRPPALDDKQLVRALKALAHGTRFDMVQRLAAAGELSCGRLAETFDVAQPTISHHLKILTDAGLLEARREGQHHFLSVNQQRLAALSTLLVDRLTAKRRRRGVTTT